MCGKRTHRDLQKYSMIWNQARHPTDFFDYYIDNLHLFIIFKSTMLNTITYAVTFIGKLIF